MIATTGRPRLDRLAGPKLDIFFSPNIHFTSVSPETAHAITIHDLSFEHLPNCYTQKQRLWHKSINPKKQCQQADIIITPSEHTKRDVAKTYGIPESKMTAIHPGLAPGFALEDLQGMDRVRNTYGLRQRYILFLGTLEPRKNITTAIDAFVDSGLRSRGYELIIAGAHGWHTRPILQNIQRTDGVRHIGYVRSEDKPALYRLADVFVYPSLYEGFGFPVLEAMASGTPVITSHRASLPEVGGNAVWYVNPMNTKEIATAMEAVVSDSTISELYMDRGRLQAKRFCWNRAARRCLSLFQTV